MPGSTDAAKLSKLAADIRIAMLTTVDPEGNFVSRPMGQQEVEPDGTLWFSEREELWNPFVEAWLPQGPTDPSVVLIKVDGHTAEYWDTHGSKVASLISFAKTKLTGERYDGGENETVAL